ncbi:cadherin-like beta sandwich domain-containing protein [Cohnella yongneupensis]|uniref:Cadherin-like beta sandwich domain-containing protein n=1 Tax=Cohnella yongneupensis TaxID=425006 RepID=A0ABW0R0V9_9BACL
MRKGLVYLLAILLVVVPLLGSLSKEAYAATSRVAVIKELKGTVKVKKSGGSKEFTAFAKMSLNEGDVLAIGTGGSAVLQFANGTSEDDRMTVSSDTTLTFSKLSSKKGTTTKVSMWKGSAWVDVKSITSADDKFTLETPTAVMGVRGTHLLVSVNPDTGATRLMVAAGVVTTTATGENGNAHYVYPTQNALITGAGAGAGEESDITIASTDLETLIKQSDADIIQAILLASADITAENEQYVARYENSGAPEEIGGTEADLARFKSNTENLLGAIAHQALESGLIDEQRLKQIVDAVKAQSGFEVDLSKNAIQLTDAERKQQELQRQKEAEAKKQADERAAKEEDARKKDADMLRLLEDAKKAKRQAALEAEALKKKQAKEEYERQLSESEKARYDAERQQREKEAAAALNGASPTPSSSLSSNANLSNLAVTNGTLPFVSGKTDFTMEVGNYVNSLSVTPTVADSSATVKVNETAVASGSASGAINLTAGTSTDITVEVRAADGTTKRYTLTVYRAGFNVTLYSLSVDSQWVSGFTSGTSPSSNGYTVVVAQEAQSITINAFASDFMNATVTGTGVKTLAAGSNSFDVTVTATDGTRNVYTLKIVRAMLSGIALERLSPDGFWVSMGTSIIAQDHYNLASMMWPLPNEYSKMRFTPLTVPGATIVSINNVPYEGGYIEASLEVGANNYNIKALAADGVTELTYTLNLDLESFQVIPRDVTGWTTITEIDPLTPLQWNYVDVNTFSTQVSGAVNSFTTTLQFKTDRGVTSATLFRKVGNEEEAQPIATWSASGTSQTITGLNPGLNQYALRFYTGSFVSDYYTLNVVKGNEDPNWTALGEVQLVDDDKFAYLGSPSRSGDLSYFAKVDADVSRLQINISGMNYKELYFNGSSVPLKPVYDGGSSYVVNLEPGYNPFDVVVRDVSGQFQKMYKLTILRSDAVPNELKLYSAPYLYEDDPQVGVFVTEGIPNVYVGTVARGKDHIHLAVSNTQESTIAVYYEDNLGAFKSAMVEGGDYRIPIDHDITKVTIVLFNAEGENIYPIYLSYPPQ